MSNLYVIIFGKRQAAVSLFEQLVRYYFSGIQQVEASYLSSLYVIVFLEDSKWRLLYLSNLYAINIFERQQVAASLFEQLVCHNSFFGRQQVAASLFEATCVSTILLSQH